MDGIISIYAEYIKPFLWAIILVVLISGGTVVYFKGKHAGSVDIITKQEVVKEKFRKSDAKRAKNLPSDKSAAIKWLLHYTHK